ncbi:hypothetical protein DL96DRAFT_1681450 [Flagelloscypha sp. PMI_526]|nr:hypothetical protein DL96DRAFT_1681450 [Flagelloscypha sp. PMI_526]
MSIPSLPVDIYPQIFQFSSNKHLKSFSLVNTDFRRAAHSLLFWEIRFDMERQDHWDFFGAAVGRGKELCSSAKSLHVVSFFPEYRDDFKGLLRSFTSLRYLRFELVSHDRVHPSIWSSFMETVCPNLWALDICNIGEVPLRDLLSRSPSLTRCTLVNTSRQVFPTPIAISGWSLPKIRSLHLEGSGLPQSEFLEPFSSIQSVEFLELFSSPPRERINSLEYVQNSKPNLKHISFGVDFYGWVVDKYRNENRPQISLSEVPQLEKLSFTIRFLQEGSEWAVWFSWLGLQIQRSPPPNFRKVKLTIISGLKTNPYGKDPFSHSSPDNEFNALAEDPNITVSLCFVIQTQWSEYDSLEKKVAMDYERTVRFIKEVFPSWWNLGRLEIVREWL